MRLIDADAFKEQLKDICEKYDKINSDGAYAVMITIAMLDEQPTTTEG